jgi:hypothetical protein
VRYIAEVDCGMSATNPGNYECYHRKFDCLSDVIDWASNKPVNATFRVYDTHLYRMVTGAELLLCKAFTLSNKVNWKLEGF